MFRNLVRVTLVLAGGVAAAAWVPRAAAHADDDAGMARAAARFVAALPEAQRQRAMFALDSGERLRWHYIPRELFPRQGIAIRELDDRQRALAQALLRTGLSASGYTTANTIMDLERVLRAMRKDARFARDPDDYSFTVFGTPAPGGTWAWRVEGHHLSLHFTVVDGHATVSTPSFFGANPATETTGLHAGRRALGRQEDAGWALVRSLDPAQRAQARLDGDVPDDLASGVRVPLDPLAPGGLPAKSMTSGQRALLEALLQSYTALMANDIARTRWTRIRAAGLDTVSFAWLGSAEPGQPHYYRIQGPSFLVEFDNTQNNANHIHSVWRDFAGDFGEDLLREHLGSTRR
jgi:hypothetical protein